VATVPCPYLSVDTESDAVGPVLRLRGELDVVGKDLLQDAISAVLDSSPRLLAVDLSGLAFMDCAGASVLRRASDQLAARQAKLQVTGAQPSVSRLFGLLGLDSHLRLNADGGRTQRGTF